MLKDSGVRSVRGTTAKLLRRGREQGEPILPAHLPRGAKRGCVSTMVSQKGCRQSRRGVAGEADKSEQPAEGARPSAWDAARAGRAGGLEATRRLLAQPRGPRRRRRASQLRPLP